MGRGRDRVGPQATCIVGAGGGGLKVVLDGYVERIATRQKHFECGRAVVPAVQGACKEAHPKHAYHACDAGRVEAQRLIKRLRLLPSKNKMRA